MKTLSGSQIRNTPKQHLILCNTNLKCVYICVTRFGDDIELMTGQRPNWYWMTCWKYVSPIAMVIILLASLAKMTTGTSYQAWHGELVRA